MNKNSPSQNKYLFDFATISTLSGILLYNLGWMYWQKYFLTLSIQPSLIDIPFDKILLTTWYLLLGVLIYYIFLFQQYSALIKLKYIEVVDLALLLAFPIYNIITSEHHKYEWYILVCLVSLFILIKYLQKVEKIPKKFLTMQLSQILILVTIYISGIYFYRKEGEKDATALKEKYCENISLTMKDGKIKHGKFITFMNNKYFMLIEDADCKIETFVINDGEVLEIKFVD